MSKQTKKALLFLVVAVAVLWFFNRYSCHGDHEHGGMDHQNMHSE